MVFCELLDPLTEDYGQRILRLSQDVIDILGIENKDIIEVIFGTKRIGVVACLDPTIETKTNDSELKPPPDIFATKSSPESGKKDKDLPKPRGLSFQGTVEIDPDVVYPVRLDGQVRLSLGVGIGGRVEVDTILKPEKAKKVFVSVLGRDPQLISEEERQLLFNQLQLQPEPITAGLISGVNLTFKEEKILIQATEPDGIVLKTKKTIFELIDTFVPQAKDDSVTYEQIGGLKDVIHRVRKLVEVPIRRPEVFNAVNITPPRGILIAGPTGIGKSLLLRVLANESHAKVIEVPPNLFAGVGPTEKNIRGLFHKVKAEAEKTPVLLFLDNMEALTPAPYLNIPQYIRRFTVQFALGFDSLKGTNSIVIGTCHSVANVNPIMRRPGRFDIEIEMMVPSEQERLEILKIQLRTVPMEDDITEEILRSFVHRMIGYVGADIASFVKEACMRSVSRYSDLFSVWTGQIPPSVLRMIRVNREDFEEAFKAVEPSALRSIHSKFQNPNVRWTDIGGLNDIKQLLKEQIEWQFENPEVLKEMGVKPSQGILLYGPPGNGKTLLAKAVATEMKANFISVKGPELLSVWFGESAKIIRELFSRAKKLAPCIIFFDEIDAMVPRRGGNSSDGGREIDATVNQLLTLLDGMDSTQGIFVMGATNRPGALDLALLRPGRLDRLVLVPSPDEESRKEILRIHLRNVPIENTNNNQENLINEIVTDTNLFSGADLENIVRESVLVCLREDFKQRVVRLKHFKEALNKVSPSVSPALQQYYNKFASEVIGAKGKEIISRHPFTYD
ncbi:MAG: AAA family ATPase [Candidatus Hodarchaeales archaeon]|jgi:transitional endoplasmic reticulum ATPase